MKATVCNLTMLLLVSTGHAQSMNCPEFVKDVFNVSVKKAGATSSSSFRAWQCTQNFKTHEEAMNSGLDVGVVLYGVPLQIGGTFDASAKGTWKHDHCSEEERSQSSDSASYEFLRTYAPESAALGVHCLNVLAKMLDKRAVQCEFPVSGNSPVFTVRWNRTDGDNAPPKIRQVTVTGGACSPAFKKNEVIAEGAGRPAICNIVGQGDLVVAADTSRGSCVATLLKDPPRTIISGAMSLTSTKTFEGEILEIHDDTRIITNGFPLTLIGTREIRILGDPQIESFSSDTPVRTLSPERVAKRARLG